MWKIIYSFNDCSANKLLWRLRSFVPFSSSPECRLSESPDGACVQRLRSQYPSYFLQQIRAATLFTMDRMCSLHANRRRPFYFSNDHAIYIERNCFIKRCVTVVYFRTRYFVSSRQAVCTKLFVKIIKTHYYNCLYSAPVSPYLASPPGQDKNCLMLMV